MGTGKGEEARGNRPKHLSIILPCTFDLRPEPTQAGASDPVLDVKSFPPFSACHTYFASIGISFGLASSCFGTAIVTTPRS